MGLFQPNQPNPTDPHPLTASDDLMGNPTLTPATAMPAALYLAAVMPRPRLRRMGSWREALDLVLLVAAIYALVNLATVRFMVEGPSMEPTFHSDQFLIISRVHYLIGEPERGDIVVFHAPGNPDDDYIKRLIGLPGETIEFFNQEVYINGEKLYEPYINEPCRPVNCPDATYVLGSDEYFMMGDNRNRSTDSREFQQRGIPVKREAIVGEVIIRYWPYNEVGIMTKIGFPNE